MGHDISRQMLTDEKIGRIAFVEELQGFAKLFQPPQMLITRDTDGRCTVPILGEGFDATTDTHKH